MSGWFRETPESLAALEEAREEVSRSEIEARARELQAAGPDEFPWGYYVAMAEEEAETAALADEILAKTPGTRKNGMRVMKAEEVPPPAPEPERPLATTLAEAYANGFDDAATQAGRCCGCSVRGINPHDGKPV